ncbi:transmembrane protein 272-like [Penaeus monodon]|uniref:transmembrane protein 272-like n=1 Tax=Penaeus monodon TaxID=6687 RepID=UPI0018A715A1|nr:transmembrane protein 272-like [Penaeus monodon]XP_037787828.1 transmembrane protein 272-like [Penaeus monodon]XP_037787829.1 transmembrane protein 272-like [Penaeus monodon]
MAEENANPEQRDAEQGQIGAEKQGKGIALAAVVLGGVVMGILTVAFALLSLGLTIAFITVGAIYQDDCNVEPMIPVWLIVQGVISFVLTLSGQSKNSERKSVFSLIKIGLLFIVQLFAFGWFIVGNVWVFTAWAKNPDFEDLTQKNSCHKGLFYLALIGGVILPYAGLALILTIICCVWVCKRIAMDN